MTYWPTHIVLFDGECNFCNSSVQFIFNRDRKKVFRFAGLQSPIGKQIISDFKVSNVDFNSLIYINNGRVFQKSDAVLRIAMKLHGLWFLMGIFLIIPKKLRDLVYYQIAKRRHQILRNKCVVPSEEMRASFLK